MSEFLSHTPLLVGMLPILLFGFVFGLVGLYFARRERLESLARRKAAETKNENLASESPKAAHA